MRSGHVGEKREPDEEPRKPGRPADRVSLKPLEFEEALRDLMATGRPDESDDDEAAPST